MMPHHLDILNIIWLTIGFVSQAVFGGRFLIQWLYSEKHRRSVIPMAFWWCSIFGGIGLLLYSLHKRDLVFISGQLFGLIIYARNIWLIYNERRAQTQRPLPVPTK
jgi:lipid-A-disaccharide synthase-like uncharacterized protein